jgi:hypothetical protein
MRAMADALSADHERRLAMVARAQERMRTGELTKQGYAERHRQLTERLLTSLPAAVHDTAAMESCPPQPGVKVFVLLGHGFGANRWRERYERGLIPGLN